MKTPVLRPESRLTTNLTLLAQAARAADLASVLRAALARAHALPRPRPGEPRPDELWLLGRAEEVVAFARDIDEDVHAGGLSEEEAGRSLAGFLDAIDEGLARHTPAPPCTGLASSRYDTAPASPDETHPYPSYPRG